jgi:hypothetical protein
MPNNLGRCKSLIWLASALAALGSLPALQAQSLHGRQTPTVAAVQGTRTDLNTASSFLTGCRISCQDPANLADCDCFSAILHVPESWLTVHLHQSEIVTDYTRFYLDRTVMVDSQGHRGLDRSSPNGLEGEQLLFYVGEGVIDKISAINSKNKSVDLSSISLGDGRVRYLWMVSCNVFAHGPQTSTGPGQVDFASPEQFLTSPAGVPRENVFYRWAHDYDGIRRPLNRRLRLACGGSSKLNGGLYPTHLLWHYFSHLGLGPADSFLLGLYKPESFEIPLCISQGGSRPGTSGLYDARLETEPLETTSHVYIEYPVAGDGKDPLTQKVANQLHLAITKGTDSPSTEAPIADILSVEQTPVQTKPQGLDFARGQALDYGFVGGSAKTLGLKLDWLTEGLGLVHVSEDDVCVKRQPKSGAVVFSWRPTTLSPALVEDGNLMEMAARLVNHFLNVPEITTNGIVFREARPIEMRVDGTPAAMAQSSDNTALDRSRKCRYLRLTAETTDSHIPILGEGGEALVAVCPQPDGTTSNPEASAQDVCHREALPLLSLSYSNRRAKAKVGQLEAAPKDLAVAQKRLNEVKAEAFTQLGVTRGEDAIAYDTNPVRWRWGYRAAPIHCGQDEMYLVYQFDFLPKPQDQFRKLPPVTVEVPAHPLKSGSKRVEDTWDCSPEQVED